MGGLSVSTVYDLRKETLDSIFDYGAIAQSCFQQLLKIKTCLPIMLGSLYETKTFYSISKRMAFID